MGLRLSAALAAELSLSSAIAFSQTAWSRTHLPGDPSSTHCAGLCAFWLRETIDGRAALDRLARPTDDVVRYVARVQAASFYPSFPDGYEPDVRDRSRLADKYGSSDWIAIRKLIDRDHQGDPLLHDLSQLFEYRAAAITRVDDWSHVAERAGRPAPGSATLGVLRYRQRGAPVGHRIAWFVDDRSVHRFFDPNIGEVTCATEAAFGGWLDAFVTRTNYRRASRSTDPFLVTYSLEGARPAAGGDRVK